MGHMRKHVGFARGMLAAVAVMASISPVAAQSGPTQSEPVAAPSATPVQTAPASAQAPGDELWDARFGAPGIPDGQIEAVAIAPNGDAYVGGWFDIEGVPDTHSIARWDGQRWHPLDIGVSGGFARVRDIAIHGNDVYVIGNFTSAGGGTANHIARWDGTQWSPVGTGDGPTHQTDVGPQDGDLNAIAIAPNGDVYVGGYFNQIDDVPAFSVARWDGQNWHALGTGIADIGSWDGATPVEAYVFALAIAADGSVYVGGKFTHAGNAATYSIARWANDAWSALGVGIGSGDTFDPAGEVYAIATRGTTVYAAGHFTKAGGQNANNIAQWNGTTWSTLGAGLTYPVQFSSDVPVSVLMVDGNTLVAGGKFTRAGNTNMAGIARWNGTSWSAIGPALFDTFDLTVKTLAATGNGAFIAAGTIEKAGPRFVFGITKWTGDRWANLGEGVSSYSTSPDDIQAIAVDNDGRVYIGGVIRRAGGLPVNHVAMWDGTRWDDMGGGVTGDSPIVYALLTVGIDVYVAGNFTQAGGIAASRIAKWNPITRVWTPLGSGIDNTVYALAFGNGVLYAGGGFTRAGNAEAFDVAAWNGQAWQGLGGNQEIFEIFNTGSEAGTWVRALAFYSGRLYMGGHFQTLHQKGTPTNNPANYLVVHNVASYDIATQAWNALGSLAAPGVNTNGFSGFGTDVYALAAVNGGIFVGGTFNRAGNGFAQNLARYDVAANTWSAPANMGGVPTSGVYALSARGNDLFIGGAFTSIGPIAARFIARYNPVLGAWANLGSGMRWYNDNFTRVQVIAATIGGVYVGGKFDYAGLNPSIGFARWGAALPTPAGFKIFLGFIRR